jgi:thiamine-monophosphate kinase
VSRELERIERLAAVFAVGSAGVAGVKGIVCGIGDDAAVLDPALRHSRLVWTIDAQVSGVHFRPDLVSWRDVGWRSFMAAASDLAAMGATPWCALSALVLDRGVDDEALAELTRGQADAAREVEAPVVGGNLSRGTETSITTTLLGSCERPVQRGAREGDGVWIAGDVGFAAAGLAILRSPERDRPLADPEVDRAVLAWRRPRARIADGLAMAGVAYGAIDVSDGLARDLSHLAAAGGLRAVLEESALESHVGPALASVARRIARLPLELALHGGEDYALVAASTVPVPGFTRIGHFERGAPGEVALRDPAGLTRAIAPDGWDHFA